MIEKEKTLNIDILSAEFYLKNRKFDMWNCYSEYSSSYNNCLHFHNFYELSVIYEGSSGFLINGSLFSMKEKSLQLIRPCDYHRQITGKDEHIRYYNLIFTPDFLSEELLRELERNHEPIYTCAESSEWESILVTLQNMYQEFCNSPEDPLSVIFIRNSLENICVFLLRNRKNGSLSAEVHLQKYLQRAISYIQKNYRFPIRLSDAAEAAGLSPSYFSTVFRSAMNISFSNYLLSFRLQEAARYLSSSDLAIKQIAPVCGFPSYSYFVTAFRNHYGITPAAWRRHQAELR